MTLRKDKKGVEDQRHGRWGRDASRRRHPSGGTAKPYSGTRRKGCLRVRILPVSLTPPSSPRETPSESPYLNADVEIILT
ncbi:hypothetical protein EVAR_50293_1 [Eumeta japonica]|uniref:Uncharacterized protein n=1 Tax=Eumeta variegata TaxID=151549 RepID=A0A4C1XTQ5_EUMVA|nr:hypothetical protein EVAR_50293_1 [Eumeta japonica]